MALNLTGFSEVITAFTGIVPDIIALVVAMVPLTLVKSLVRMVEGTFNSAI